MRAWEELPEEMKHQEVYHYYQGLQQKQGLLVGKRIFDIVMSALLIVILFPVMVVIGIAVKVSSPGEIIFRQTRVTTYGKRFQIYKFRTMTAGAMALGSQVTVSQDARVTGIGRFLRKVRLDELPQLFNIIKGEMTFVGTRPEVEKYVECYTREMYATLLLPAGVTSPASIEYKDEEQLLSDAEDVDETYVNKILPQKMKYNLEYIGELSFRGDMGILFRTLAAVIH